MRPVRVLVCAITFLVLNSATEFKKPTVLISVLARNKAHTLPYFLSNLQRLNYPKDRISIWIRSDHNSDDTILILKEWLESVKDEYHSIYTLFSEGEEAFKNESGPAHWTDERFSHVINLRESALNYARKIWADFLLSIDCDVFLTNPNTLNYLIEKNVTIIAPMLKSEGLYSNFWHGMSDDFYYERTDEYQPILYRENVGCFEVPMIHSCVLVNLRRIESDFLTYIPKNIPEFDGPNDDIITFAISAKYNKIPLNLCNEHNFGYVTIPLDYHNELSLDFEQLTNIKLEVLNDGETLFVNDVLNKYTSIPDKDKMGFDEIFMINLLRRPDRRKRMRLCFDELGLDVRVVNAVDGKSLNQSVLKNISFLPNYADPYHKRPMTTGEIGCFLSHYQIWKEIKTNNYQTTLVLEDDIRFEPYFKIKVRNIMNEVKNVPNWDLIYFGRKRMQEQDEPWVEGADHLVNAGYSYWTLGYALSSNGAEKLLRAEPLSKLVPVDEYLPILFDRHPRDEWKRHYWPRDLVALSAAPLLVYPTHYTGEEGYVSDTEDSSVVQDGRFVAREDL